MPKHHRLHITNLQYLRQLVLDVNNQVTNDSAMFNCGEKTVQQNMTINPNKLVDESDIRNERYSRPVTTDSLPSN